MSDARSHPIDPSRRVYVNRDLKLGNIDWIGFDMDYTLAIYRQKEMDKLSVRAIVDKLVKRGYPEWIRDVDYPIDFPIRGVLIDKKLGNILKMNRFKVVRRGYHGLQELSPEALAEQYYTRKLRLHLDRYHWIDTLYGLSEACAYGSLIEAYRQRGVRVDYAALFSAIRACIDEAHRDGSILDTVAADRERFVEQDPALAATLHKLRSAGKRLFVLTNSHQRFTEGMLSHLLDGQLPDYPSYHHYFDAIIVAAKKPSFFQTGTELRMHRDGQLVAAGDSFERGTIYHGGNIEQLQRMLQTPSDRVLYVGDHIYGDIIRSKRESAWRTALVVQELDTEVAAHTASREQLEQWDMLYERRSELEDELRLRQTQLKRLEKISRPSASQTEERDLLRTFVQSIRKQLRTVNAQTAELRETIDQSFHRYWGSLLKQEAEMSLFGAQVDRYACVYTSRVTNFMPYSAHQYFRSPRGLMHHEL